MSPPSAVFCDVGDVLFYDFPVQIAFSWFFAQELERIGGGAGLGPWDILEARGRWTAALKQLPQPVWSEANHRGWQRVLQQWDALFVPIPGALEWLASREESVALVANQPACALPALQRACPSVRGIFLDTIEGVSKPASGLFERALSQLGTAPQDTIMIGDRLDNDILPARRLGLQAAWIAPLAYDPELPVAAVPSEWRARREEGLAVRRRARLARGKALPAALQPEHMVSRLSLLQWG